jgi:prepilin-type N-terminal cleavage/methylation domain-containing protein
MKNTARKSNGLSIIEMLCTVAVLGIIAVSATNGIASVKQTIDVENSRSKLIDLINDSRTNSIKHSQYICTTIRPDSNQKNTSVKAYMAKNLDQVISCPCNTPNQCILKEDNTLEKTSTLNGTNNNINILHEGKTGSLLSNTNIKIDISHSQEKNISKRQVEVQVGGLATVSTK